MTAKRMTMSDNLVKRLREDQPVSQDIVSTIQCALQDAAADRIEALESKLSRAVEVSYARGVKDAEQLYINYGPDFNADIADKILKLITSKDKK